LPEQAAARAGGGQMNISFAVPGLSLHAPDPLAHGLGGHAHPPCGPVRLLRTGEKCSSPPLDAVRIGRS
jgi:hypothetical protein